MVNKKFYVTTAIDYPNAEPHIGHAYQKVIADALARWHKLKGEKVFFLTGTDEHGKKIEETAKASRKKPKEFVDELSEKFKDSWKLLNVEYDRFIRTTDKDHEKIVQGAIKKCQKNGDIYLGEYEGLYCIGCEAYYTEKDLIEGKCPFHNKPVEKIKEKSYFFKLGKYQKFLLELYEKHPEFILPKERRNEMSNRVKEGLKDLSISRTSFDWGIPFPGDKEHVIYVWFDALFNYLTGAGKKQELWPADLHLLGKDNAWFHTVYWPAFLKSAGYKLPKTVFVHGFLTFNGQKISKSLGNAISPKTLVKKYSSDSVRYFIFRNFVFGEDGDFSESTLIERNNSELANKLGNLVSRTTALAEKYGIEKTKNKLLEKLNIKKIEEQIDNYQFDKAIQEIFSFIDYCNEFVQKEKIWETQDKKKLYELIDSIKAVAIILWPFIPESSKKIAKNLNFKIEYKNIAKPLEIKKVKKSEILFKKIELEKSNNKSEEIKENKNINKQKNIEGIVKMVEIKFEDWAKIELRVGKITKVEDIKDADKLYKLEIDLGKEVGKRTICAGLKEYYKKDELKNKKIILFTNLTPRKMKGIESQGMLLAAVSNNNEGKNEKVVLISPEKDIELGSKIS